ncbi:HpcH/HpaI aldolase family protein [Persicitalea jodogahamensis]|uniref:2,4-dihydroxyhept-2-ene-1,7-dioic acid aldolase n=1 Tax=Persicitalea jodogahamensis TaxID=402147 RepID=A0A8J3D2C3_9BACT|nr:aldolase/citrate lyase family protein [Persicitalea jodogahamensis]GHB57589.1 2,4-dihydroxyhept-2-ene-1,7-dioic acid aldolase [Persicitalea jodogahamensis]
MNFRQRLHTGEIMYGLTLTLGTPQIAEMIARLGFDWIWIETEHTTMNLDTVQAQLQAIAGNGTAAVVRVDCNDQTTIKRILDTGPDGVIIPSINSRAEAEEAVKFSKYPPLGERGIGLARAQGYGLDLGGYVKSANDEVAVIFMIEHIRAVQDIDNILKVDGLDAVMVGSLDLAGSMNLHNDLANPLIELEVQKVLRACQRAGVPCGAFVGDPSQAKTRIEQGFRLLTLGADVLLLAAGARNALATAKSG